MYIPLYRRRVCAGIVQFQKENPQVIMSRFQIVRQDKKMMLKLLEQQIDFDHDEDEHFMRIMHISYA